MAARAAGIVLAATLTLQLGAEQRGAGGQAASAPEITLREFEPVSMLKVKQNGGVQWNRIDEPDFGRLAAEQLAADVVAGARGLKIFKAFRLSVRDRTRRLVAMGRIAAAEDRSSSTASAHAT